MQMRLSKEIAQFESSKVEGIKLLQKNPKGSILAVIQGPLNTPWQPYEYLVLLRYPKDYPFSAPQAEFLTTIFHPNISDNGVLCIDILKDKWSPVLTLEVILISIRVLIGEPCCEDPANPKAAEVFENTKQKFFDENNHPKNLYEGAKLKEYIEKSQPLRFRKKHQEISAKELMSLEIRGEDSESEGCDSPMIQRL